jgi:radical SAM protein with 4Fe4S-binding SPASM domain
LPLIDTINLSMDGVTPETFARNRGGADIERVWRNVSYYHDLRRRAGLARAPRLAFAWTLKRNNINELPAFVRKIATYDADVLTARHMIIFFSAEKDQSLLQMPPADVNPHLAAAYDLLQEFGIQRMFIHSMPVIMASGEVMACAVPHAAKAGNLGETATFGAIWNGATLRDIRRTLNTEAEWPQCRTCSYREARVTSQRNLAAAGERYESEQKAVFSEESLNFAGSGL